jgi:hypothetical protein
VTVTSDYLRIAGRTEQQKVKEKKNENVLFLLLSLALTTSSRAPSTWRRAFLRLELLEAGFADLCLGG